jgi:hypothetical protein
MYELEVGVSLFVRVEQRRRRVCLTFVDMRRSALCRSRYFEPPLWLVQCRCWNTPRSARCSSPLRTKIPSGPPEASMSPLPPIKVQPHVLTIAGEWIHLQHLLICRKRFRRWCWCSGQPPFCLLAIGLSLIICRRISRRSQHSDAMVALS